MTYLRVPLRCSTAQWSKLVHSFHLFLLLPYSILLKKSRNFPRNSDLKSKFVFVWAGGGQAQEQRWWFCVQFHSILYVWSAFTLHTTHCPHLPIFKPHSFKCQPEHICHHQKLSHYAQHFYKGSDAVVKHIKQLQCCKLNFRRRKKEVAFPFWSRGNSG